MALNQLWLWGRNGNGELGDDTTNYRSSPVQTICGGTDWKQVSCGYEYTLAIKNDGSLWAWGWGGEGGLGNNQTTDHSSPIQIGTDNSWKFISTSPTESSESAAIKSNGTLWMWGLNAYCGQLGLGNTSNKSSPTQVGTDTTWSKVSSNAYFTGAIKTDGTLWMWGCNGYGNLGTDNMDAKSSPVQTITGGTNWSTISCGYSHVASLKNNGTLWVWGSNSSGQLGNDSNTNRSSPIQVFSGSNIWLDVKAGSYFTVGLQNDGTLWSWGYNGYGQLGLGDTNNRSSPEQIGSSNDWIDISAGTYHVIARKNDGSIWAWGENYNGKLGDNTTTNRSLPVQISTGSNSWSYINAGGTHSAALLSISEPTVVTSCANAACGTQTGLSCIKSNVCTCAKWKFFYPQCSRANIASGTCSGRSGAYVASVTVCSQNLF